MVPSSYVDRQQARQVTLEGPWPGLDEPTGLEVEPETLEGFGAALRGELDGAECVSPETLQQQVGGSECAGWFGYWLTGAYMEYSLQVAGGGIAFYYRKVLQEAYAAAALFDVTAAGYRQVDQAAGADLQAGWDQLAGPVEPTAMSAPVAGVFQESTPVPYISEYEDVSGYDADWVSSQMRRLSQAQVWRPIAQVGGSLEQVAGRLDDLAELVRVRAGALAEQWSSDTSVACQQALRRIAGTAAELAQCCWQVSGFAVESADTVQRAVQGFEDDRGLGEKFVDLVTLGGDPNREAGIRQALEALNEAYRDINYTMLPPYLNANLPELPPADDPYSERVPSGASDSRGGYVPPGLPSVPAPPLAPTGPASAPEGSSGVLGPGQLGPGSGFPGGGIPAESSVPAGGLAGAGGPVAPGTGAGAGPAGGVPASPGGGAPSGVGAAPGAGPGTAGPGGTGVVPGATAASGQGARAAGGGGVGRSGGGAGVVGAPRGAGTGAGGGRDAAGSRGGGRRGVGPSGVSAGAGAGARGGVGGVAPMAGRAGGAGNRDEPEQGPADSWLEEDEDPWRGPDDGVPPPVIR